MLSPQLLGILRTYWRLARPKTFLFPGRDDDHPIHPTVLHAACRSAVKAAGLTKRVTLHTCREHVKMSGLRSTSNVRSGADALWAGWASRARPPRPQACCEADLRSGLGRADLIDQGSVRLIVGEPPRTVEDREPAVRVFVNAHGRLDEVAAVTLLGDLQHATRVADRVVVPHHALRLDA